MIQTAHYVVAGLLGLAVFVATIFAWGKGVGKMLAAHAATDAKLDAFIATATDQMRRTEAKVDGFHTSMDRAKGAVRDVQSGQDRLEGRMDTVERLIGLPPLIKRTQPMRPIDEMVLAPEE